MSTVFRSGSPIASTLDMVDDRWSLIIIRDLLNGKRRFTQFLDSPERITPSVLTDKLSSLMRHELVVKRAYCERPKRYEFELTHKGEAMIVILQAMCTWAQDHVPGTWPAPESFMARRVGEAASRLG